MAMARVYAAYEHLTADRLVLVRFAKRLTTRREWFEDLTAGACNGVKAFLLGGMVAI